MSDHVIIPRAAWGAAAPIGKLSPMTAPDGWVVHYVGSAKPFPPNPTLEDSAAVCRQLQADAFANKKERYIDIPYSFMVDSEGRIFEGRGWDYKSGANGSATYNGHAWAVCVLLGVGNALTTDTHDAVSWLTQEGARRKPAVSYVKGHRDVYSTACPGDPTYASVPEWHAHLHDPEVVTPPIDWAALAELAAWVHRVSVHPLRHMDLGPDVVTLKKLLANHQLDVGNRAPLYGDDLVNYVKLFKVSRHMPNQDGEVCGADCARELLKP